MDHGLLSLKWNRHNASFHSMLSNIRAKELFSDVTLACGGKLYSVHKFVLSTCSEYFEVMFQKTECKHPIIVLKDITCSDLEYLLDFMYIGEVSVSESKLSSLIGAAECLKIRGLAVPDEPENISNDAQKRLRKSPSNCNGKRRRDVSPELADGKSKEKKSIIKLDNKCISDPVVSDEKNGCGIKTTNYTDSSIKSSKICENDEACRTSSCSQARISNITSSQELLPSIKDEPFEAGNENFSDIECSDSSQNLHAGNSDSNCGVFNLLAGKCSPASMEPSVQDSFLELSKNVPREINEISSVFRSVESAQSSETQSLNVSSDEFQSLFTSHPNKGQLELHYNMAQFPTGEYLSGRSSYLDTTMGSILISNSSSTPLLYREMGTGPDRFVQCCLCPYRSQLKGNMKKHLLTHTGAKPFSCPNCPYRTAEKSNLNRHARAHFLKTGMGLNNTGNQQDGSGACEDGIE